MIHIAHVRNALSLLNALLIGTALAQWYPEESGTSYDLMDALAFSSSQYAVGYEGTILRRSNGVWEQMSTPTTEDLMGISYSTAFWVCGTNGVVLRKQGSAWELRHTGTSYHLCGIQARGVSTAVAVGSSGAILKTTDGGVTWAQKPSGVSVVLNDIGYPSYVAVGENGTIVRSTDEGETWQRVSSGTSEDLIGVHEHVERLWACGRNGVILKSTDFGATWSSANSGTRENLWDMANSSINSIVLAVGTSGTIIQSTDGGSTWSPMNSGTPYMLCGSAANSTSGACAVGASGTILHMDLVGITEPDGNTRPVRAGFSIDATLVGLCLAVELPGSDWVERVVVVDAAGHVRRAVSGVHGQCRFDIADLPEGAYFVWAERRGLGCSVKVLKVE